MKAAKKLYAAYLRQYPLETPWSELDQHEKQDWAKIAKEFLEANVQVDLPQDYLDERSLPIRGRNQNRPETMSDFLNTIKSTAAGRARLDFFDNLPETPSPRILWMRKHGLTVTTDVNKDDGDWFTAVKHNGKVIIEDPSEDRAIVRAAQKLNLKLWNE
jgi:hypothetical protein